MTVTAAVHRVFLVVAAGFLLAAGGCEDKADVPEGDAIAVPSGRQVVLLDVITDVPGPAGATARFRFVVPGLTADQDASADMQAVCDSYAMPRTEGMVPQPQQIIITFADRAVPFGEPVADAVQFFEAYSLRDGTCIWEMF